MHLEIDTLFFDWDHTLAHTRIANNTMGERLTAMFAMAGLPYTQPEIEEALAQYHQAVETGRLKAVPHPQRRRDIARFYRQLFDFLGEEDTSWATMERLYGTYAQLPTYLYADSRPVLTQFRERGYQLGIISNHSRSARPVMEGLVGDLIPPENIIISEELGVHKPAKTIFSHAASRLRRPAERCALVGDNLVVDAVGAVKTGGYAAGIWLDRQQQRTELPSADSLFRLTSLYEMPPLMAGMNGAGFRARPADA